MLNSNPKIEVRESSIEGLGVFAVERIERGEVILEWNPKRLTDEDIKNFSDLERQKYLYKENGKLCLQQEPERYVNHSCDPNSSVVGRSDVALRDIEPGEEITSDYFSQGFGFAPDKFICTCNSSKCRYRALYIG